MVLTQFSKSAVSSAAIFRRNGSAIAARLLASSLMVALPAGASVLIDPGIRQGGTVAPATEEMTETNSLATQDIVGVASSNGDFSTLVTAIQAANIGEILSGEGPYTVFAPTNAAFNALPPGVLDALLMPENRDLLVQLLYNHVAYGAVTSDQLVSGSLATFDGNVDITVRPDGVMVDGANVAIADVPATNGVIHAVDQVLLPTGFDSTLQARMSGGSSSSASSSSSQMTRTTTLQETAIDRSVAPTPVEAPVPTTAAPVAAPAPAATEAPVRGLW